MLFTPKPQEPMSGAQCINKVEFDLCHVSTHNITPGNVHSLLQTWTHAANFMKLLEPLSEATEILCRSTYLMLNTVLPVYLILIQHLNSFQRALYDQAQLIEPNRKMIEKINHYLQDAIKKNHSLIQPRKMRGNNNHRKKKKKKNTANKKTAFYLKYLKKLPFYCFSKTPMFLSVTTPTSQKYNTWVWYPGKITQSPAFGIGPILGSKVNCHALLDLGKATEALSPGDHSWHFQGSAINH
ncbi:uncharacterized protein VP01_2254g1, partial [Puccinia sorghi]